MRMQLSDLAGTTTTAPRAGADGSLVVIDTTGLATGLATDPAGTVAPGPWTESLLGRTVDCCGFALDLDARTADALGVPSPSPALIDRAALGLAGRADARRRARLERACDEAAAAAAAAVDASVRARREAEALTDERDALEVRRLRLEEERAEAQAELARCEHERSAIFGRHLDIVQGLDAASAHHDEATQRHAAVVAARQEVDEALELLTRRRSELEARHASVLERLGETTGQRAAALEARETRDAMATRIQQLEAQLAEHGAHDPEPVRAALQALHHTCATRGGPDDPAAVQLLEAWRALQSGTRDVSMSGDLDAARTACEAAAQRVQELEQRVRADEPSADDHAAIELAHRARLEATAAIQGRRVPERAMHELSEAERFEAQLLGRFGYSSYADYLIAATVGQSRRDSDPELMHARAELASAEARIADHEARSRAWHDATEDARRDLRGRIAGYLGTDPGDDVEAALAQPRFVPPPPPEVLFGLEVALNDCGVADGHRDPIGIATAWLAQHGDTDSQRAAHEHELDLVRRQFADAVRREAELEQDLASITSIEDEVEHLDSAIDAAALQITGLEERRDSLDSHVEEAASRMRAAADGIERTEAALRAMESEVASVATATDAARAAVQRVVVDALDIDAGLADLARRTAEATQRVVETAAAEAAATRAALDAEARLEGQTGDPEPLGDDGCRELIERLRSLLAAVPVARVAGPVPVLVDDAFGCLGDADASRLLEELTAWAREHRGQVIYLTDDPLVIDAV